MLPGKSATAPVETIGTARAFDESAIFHVSYNNVLVHFGEPPVKAFSQCDFTYWLGNLYYLLFAHSHKECWKYILSFNFRIYKNNKSEWILKQICAIDFQEIQKKEVYLEMAADKDGSWKGSMGFAQFAADGEEDSSEEEKVEEKEQPKKKQELIGRGMGCAHFAGGGAVRGSNNLWVL